MQPRDQLKLATRFYIFTLAVFALLQVVSISAGGHAAQEGFEIFADPADYTARLLAGGDTLRIILLGDMFFMIGYGGAIGLTAYAYRARKLPAAWVAGLGILLVVGLDLIENVTMSLSIDMVRAGLEIPVERILAQANISAVKWLTSGMVLVVFTFTLPDETLLERLLIWSTRIFLPLGTGLFIIGAFDARLLGGTIILLAMTGGLAMLAITTGRRAKHPPA